MKEGIVIKKWVGLGWRGKEEWKKGGEECWYGEEGWIRWGGGSNCFV